MTTTKRYPHIVRAIFDRPWAITPEKFQAIAELIELRCNGVAFSAEERDERLSVAGVEIGAAKPAVRSVSGAIAILPLFGTITQRANMMTAFSGGTSTELFGQQFRQLLADSQVGAILIEVDSPGGAVDGVPELADLILKSRGDKPIVAIANTLMASAAYWIASAADEIVAAPSALVGNIGVIAAHEDWSVKLQQEGIAVTLITAGKYKAEGNPYEPLDDEARSAIQSLVDEYYGMFTKAVAKGRGVSAEEVRSGYGEGRVVSAREAVRVGLADRVATLDETLTRLAGRKGKTASAELDDSQGATQEQRRRKARTWAAS